MPRDGPPFGRVMEARLATGKKKPPSHDGGFAFARPSYFLAGAADIAVAKSSVMLK